MRLKIYPLLSTCSKRAFIKTKQRWGKPYQYSPRGDLLIRLSRELNMTKEQVLDQIYEERRYILTQMGFKDFI